MVRKENSLNLFKKHKKNIASEEISFYVQGIFKIGSQEIDSATGMKLLMYLLLVRK